MIHGEELSTLLGDLGYPRSVVRAVTPSAQADVWSVRKAGLNIVMSMAGPRKPISLIEDCAVPLEHLAEYARRVEEIFAWLKTIGGMRKARFVGRWKIQEYAYAAAATFNFMCLAKIEAG